MLILQEQNVEIFFLTMIQDAAAELSEPPLPHRGGPGRHFRDSVPTLTPAMNVTLVGFFLTPERRC